MSSVFHRRLLSILSHPPFSLPPRKPHVFLLTMPRNRRGKGAAASGKQWVERPREATQQHQDSPAFALQFGSLNIGGNASPSAQRATWKPKGYATTAEADAGCSGGAEAAQTAPTEKIGSASQVLPQGPVGAKFSVDKRTLAKAQVRATFYPKFENEKSDQEIRIKMIETVSNGLGTLEVSLKHSGSLFMYAGNEGGAYAKNSFGNVYTAVGVFVLGQMFKEAWGSEALKKQAEFNKFLEENHMCISMELVTAVLGDHGQRPLQDYAVVTAATELGNGKPKFYSTPEIIAFCRKWRLPTNHVWLFSTRKSVRSFFAAYDALCEEGTATPVCETLNEIADISVPGSIDHIKAQGEILEGLVARIVSPESSKHMEDVLGEFPVPTCEGVVENLCPSLREICAANRSNEKLQIKALLQNAGNAMCPNNSDWFGNEKSGAHSRNADRSIVSKFLQANSTDYSTTKLQELVRLMRRRNFPAAFKCYPNFHKVNGMADDNIHFKMVIHVFSDSVFRRYQQEMRRNPGLWPLYRGFFVDVNLFKAKDEKTADELVDNKFLLNKVNGDSTCGTEGLADEGANLMIKLKFLTYKLRTFLIRNGLSILFKDGPSAYKTYYLRQMKNWGTSSGKQIQLSKMLDEWAIYIRRKYSDKHLSTSSYLTEAEPFLEQYAKRNLQNKALIGSAGNLVRTEDFMAITEGNDEEGDLIRGDTASSRQSPEVLDTRQRSEGLIVFFPGIPGCAKSALCRELLNATEGLEDDRPMHSLMGDLIKGRYWQKVAEERRRRPCTITLADKNAPNEEVWRQIEDMCRTTKASAVPIVPESEGTYSNPFSLDTLAVFIFRVLQRVNHPGNLDKSSPNAGYVLLMFYNLYEGKSRKDFEGELSERFGTVVRMPVLKEERNPLPDNVSDVLKDGLRLFKLHSNKHGRLDPSKGTYAKEWAKWEKQLREIILGNEKYLNSIQVPFDTAVNSVREQLKAVARGEYKHPRSEKRALGNIVFAAITLPVEEIKSLLDKVASKTDQLANFFGNNDVKNSIKSSHITLAHKRSHGVAAVASYGAFLEREVPIELKAILFSRKMAAFEAQLGSIDGEVIKSRNEWPHITLWTGEGVPAKEANTLPQLVSEGKGTRIDIDPPMRVSGTLNFY